MAESTARPGDTAAPGSTTGVRERFEDRHIGPDAAEQTVMLEALGYESLDALTDAAVPESIRRNEPLALPPARSEVEAIAALRELADHNEVRTSLIGMGYSDTVTPAVIRRNVLESPAWYTAYTPYQPEISQGRLEALLDFQTMVADLTGMDLANASLLDEATAAAEAMAMCRRLAPKGGEIFFVDADCHPQTIAVVRGRAEPLGIEVMVGDPDRELPGARTFGVLLQYPGSSGAVRDHAEVVARAHDDGALVAVATDLLAMTLLRSPGAIGADLVVGSAQRFGVPLGFGGPHAAFLACRDAHKRTLPGRLVGVSVDRAGRRALRLALQTREQHIRREKATSNICTAQVLLAVMAGLYARVPRPGGPARDRHARPRAHDRPRRVPTGRGSGGGQRRVVRHALGTRARTRRRGARRRGRGRDQPPAGRRRHGGDLARRDHHAGRRRGGPRRVRCPGGRRGSGVTDPDRADAYRAVPHAGGVPPPPVRDGDAAVPAPPRRP